MYDLLDGQERANKAALLLVHERYTSDFAQFVQKNPRQRVAFVANQIDEMIDEVARATGAEFEYVKSRFDQFIADAVLDTKPPREELSPKTQGDGLPPEGETTDTDPVEGVVRDDVLNKGDVDGAGSTQALEPDAKVDLSDTTSTEGDSDKPGGEPGLRAGSVKNCVRCDKPLNVVYAKHTVVCPSCTTELRKRAIGEMPNTPDELDDHSTDYLQEPVPADPMAMPYKCTICQAQGTQDQIRQHVAQDHAEVVQRKQDELGQQQQTFQPSGKTADVPDEYNEDRTVVQPEPRSPADNFDQAIQDLAEKAAAAQLSTPTEDDVHTLASQLGLPEEEVRHSLVISAMFGQYSASNGQYTDSIDSPEGYQEVSVDGNGGKIDAHEAAVPVDVVVNKVADSMNMEPNLVYQQVVDRYGDDMPDKYHASVSGERHFYLPAQMAGDAMQQQQQTQQQQQPAYDPTVGPTAPPAPQLNQQQPQQQF
jgi:DNA-directed RNA polymerase subunit RPC12/RpoP